MITEWLYGQEMENFYNNPLVSIGNAAKNSKRLKATILERIAYKLFSSH